MCRYVSICSLSAGGGRMSASTCACSLSVWCMCGRKEMQQGFGTHTRSCCSSGLQFVLSVGMYSLRRKAWLQTLSHCPVAPVFQLSFYQTDRAMGDSGTYSLCCEHKTAVTQAPVLTTILPAQQWTLQFVFLSVKGIVWHFRNKLICFLAES